MSLVWVLKRAARGRGPLRAAAVLVGLALAVPASLAPAGAQSSDSRIGNDRAADKWGAHLDLEGKLGSKRNLGEGSLFLPLYQTPETLIFGDIRMRFDDAESHEGNVGVGMRHMLESGWNIGAYGYFDRRSSPYDNYFNQITVGAEALGRDFDLRVNGYWAIGDRNRAVDSLNEASISGTSITLRGGEERSMSGFDAEVGWRAPVFDAEAMQQLRFYAGGYRFTADGVQDVAGPRLRADMSFEDLPLPWQGAKLNLGAEWQHDDPRGSQTFVGIRLRIPLQNESPAPRLTAQERRMTDTVIRDIDIVTQAGPFGAAESAVGANDQAITVINSGSTTGAALPSAVAGAGANSTVILSGVFNTTATTTLQSGQTVVAGGTTTVRSASGKTANITLSNATIAGTTAGGAGNPTIDMANNSTLTGGVISNSINSGNAPVSVRANGVTGVTVANSTISGANAGANTSIGLLFLNSSGTISGNTLSANSAPGHYAIAINLVNSTVTVTNNSFTASGGDLTRNIFLNGATINAGSTGNTLVNGGCFDNGLATGTIGLIGGGTCP